MDPTSLQSSAPPCKMEVGFNKPESTTYKAATKIRNVALVCLVGAVVSGGILAALTFTPFVVITLPQALMAAGVILIAGLIASVAAVIAQIVKSKAKEAITSDQQKFKSDSLAKINECLRQVEAPPFELDRTKFANLSNDQFSMLQIKASKLADPQNMGWDGSIVDHNCRIEHDTENYVEFIHTFKYPLSSSEDKGYSYSYILPLSQLLEITDITDLSVSVIELSVPKRAAVSSVLHETSSAAAAAAPALV